MENFVAEQFDQEGLFASVLSSESENDNFGDCATRCRNLTEGNFTDWVVTSMEQLSQFVGTAATSFNPIWTSTGLHTGTEYGRFTVRMGSGEVGSASYDNRSINCRCVR